MIYLDSAATSLQKPQAVPQAVSEALRVCASPGRGSHVPAMRAADVALDCRTLAAEFFGAPSPDNVVFTMNATHALNIALASLVRPGDRVVVSGWEHNAVTRPLHALGAELVVARAPLFDADATAEAFSKRLPGARCCVCTHVSNVFGFILPIRRIAELCRTAGVPLVIDASQSAGALRVDMRELEAAFVAMPGHKCLLGPQGTGLLLCGAPVRPLLFGGTGSNSALQDMPDFLPDRLEAGTHNVPGIAGLLAGMEAVRDLGIGRILAHEQRLLQHMCERLEAIPGLRLFRAKDAEMQAGVLSAVPESCTVEALSGALGERGVAVRAGLHCAPLAHESAGTLKTGTLRFSFSPFNTVGEVTRAAEMTAQIMKKL